MYLSRALLSPYLYVYFGGFAFCILMLCIFTEYTGVLVRFMRNGLQMKNMFVKLLACWRTQLKFQMFGKWVFIHFKITFPPYFTFFYNSIFLLFMLRKEFLPICDTTFGGSWLVEYVLKHILAIQWVLLLVVILFVGHVGEVCSPADRWISANRCSEFHNVVPFSLVSFAQCTLALIMIENWSSSTMHS